MITDFFKVTPSKRTVKIRSKKGVIFSNPNSFRKSLFYLGNLLFLSAITYTTYLYWPIGQAFIKYQQIIKDDPIIAGVTPTLIPTPIVSPTPSNNFDIMIPKISASTKIVENVSPFNQKEYLKILEQDVVAHAKGTSKPGEGNGHMSYIFAHSTQQGLSMTRKNAVFYLLGELKEGDPIYIDYHGTNYTYRVYKKAVVNASEISYLSYNEHDKEIIILQTCWPIGTDWKRLLVFAQRVNS